MFVLDVKDLTANGRKVLLILDGYRCHMIYKVLKLLESNGVIVFALPAHTSGSTQPLDVSIFGPFKEYLRGCIQRMSSPLVTNCYDVFDYLNIMSEAYRQAFTYKNIKSGFAKTGLWPIDPMVLLNVPRPVSTSDPRTILSVEGMEIMMEERRKKSRDLLGITPTVTVSGFVDTSAGLLLTSEEALKLAQLKHLNDQFKLAAKQRKEAEAARKEANALEKTRQERIRHQQNALMLRVKWYGVPNTFPRSLSVRRQIAKERKARGRENYIDRAMNLISRDTI